ncbi:MAG TPA: glycosyltransferase family 39 protein [Vicinamibacterales bacterium]|nr:glycosyltransferase family 39 protein [Vicinamibacterales bacterium]
MDRTGTRLILAIAVAKLVLNVAFHGQYGYFRDELYYLACSDHLDWGYVDHPPLSIAILKITRLLAGDSLFAIRFPAALAGAVTVVITGLIARALGGGRFAQGLAALSIALSPVVLGNAARSFSMNAFDLFFWAWGALVFVRILQGGSSRLWVLYGVIVGLGLMNKYSMGFFAVGCIGGLLLTDRRRDLLQPWFWIGGMVAALIFLPHLIWEARHDWVSLEFMRNATGQKNVPLSAGGFAAGQIMQTGLGQAVVWIAGLAFLIRARANPALRAIAWLFVIVAGVMMATHAKTYYLSPIYFPLVAAGAVAIERAAAKRALGWLRPAIAGLVIVFGVVALPFTVPVLPVDQFVRYERALGMMPKAEERDAVGDLPQHYSDMFGWEAMVAQIAAAYDQLTPAERQHAVIYVRNYGEAAAVDFFGRRYGLPRATCPHNNYWYWGSGDPEMRTAIIIGRSRTLEDNLADLAGPGRFDEATLAATTRCEYCRPQENGRMIFICRGPRFTFRDIWAGERLII